MNLKIRWPFKLERVLPRRRRTYSGAQMGRLVSDWVAMGTSGDAEIRGSLKLLRNRTRELERNNDYIQSYLREVENNTIGLGIPFESQIKMQRGNTLNDKLNTIVKDAWDSWTDKDCCHVSGKLSFSDIENLVIRSVARDGEIIIRKIRQTFGDSKVPLALEIIEADRLDDNYQGRADNGNEIRMGVELDTWGRPVAYYFFTYHPGDYPFPGQQVGTTRRMRVPADEIIHIFVTHRAGQTRGVSWIASSIMRLRHMQGYEEAEVIAARASAAIMGFVESPDGEATGDVVDGDRVTDFEPGIFKYLAPGEKVNIPNYSRPGGNFGPFMKMMLRGASAGMGASYETISKDFSESNYSSSRLSLLTDRDNWRKVQKWLIAQFHQEVFESFLESAVLSNQLPLPGYELNPKVYESVRWMPRGWAWVDPQKEVNAYRDAILGGLTSATDVVAQEGKDIRDVYATIQSERDLAKSMGLIFDTDAKNGIAPVVAPPKVGANEPVKGDETK